MGWVDLKTPYAGRLSIIGDIKKVFHLGDHVKEGALPNIGVSNDYQLIIATLQLVTSQGKLIRNLWLIFQFVKEGCDEGRDLLKSFLEC